MIMSTVQVGRSRPIWALLVTSLVLTLPIGGCLHQTAASTAPSQAAAPSELGRFQTANGLLYPPELWAAVGPSEQARFIRWRIERDLAPGTAAWGGDPIRTFTAIAAESDETTAAYLLVSAGVTDHRFAAWCSGRIPTWSRSAVRDADIDSLWMVSETSRTLGCPLTALPPGGDRLVDTSAAGNDVIPVWEAAAVLAHLTDPDAPVPVPVRPSNLRGPLDAARFLALRAGLDHQHVADAPELARQLAGSAAATDDLVLLNLVDAHLAVGDRDLAGAVAQDFDPRRVQADGEILEVPRFDGSVGSTYRMLRRYAGRLDDVLTPAERQRIRTALVAQRDTDAIYTVTADAALELLSPGSVADTVASADVAAALAAMKVSSAPLGSARASLAWASIAECAGSLHVPTPFPGLTDAAVREWTSAPAAETAPTLARFLLAAQAAGATSADPRIRTLAGLLAGFLSKGDPATMPTGSSVPGSLAVHRLTGAWPIAEPTLRQLLTDREGTCRGEFGGFLRDSAAPRSPCNVDTSLAADQLTKEITP